MNIRFHFHDTNGNACCKVQDMSTSAYVHLYCTSGYDLPAYETTFINHTGGSDTNVFQISTPMAQLDGTNYSIELYEDSSVVTPNVSYSNGIANVSFDTVSSDVSFTLRINNIGNSDYMLDEPYINPDAQFITPTYTGFNLMAQSLGTDYDNIQNNTQNQQTYSTDGTIVHVQTITNIVLTVQANEGTPYKVNIDGTIYYLNSNNQVTFKSFGSAELYAVYDANNAKYLNVDGYTFGACDDYYMSISSDTITVDNLTSTGHTHYSPNYDMPVSGTWTDGNNTLQTWNGESGIEYNSNSYNCNYDTSTNSMYYIEDEGCDYKDGTISDTFVYDSTNDEWTYEGNTFTRSSSSLYRIYTSVIGQGTITGNDSPYNEGDTATLTAVPASGWVFDHWTDGDNYQEYYDNPLELTMNSYRNIAVRFIQSQPSYYELKCSFNYGGSVRPAKTFIRWGTNEPYTQITYGGVNPEAFSWQEQSVPSGEIGTLVVEFVDSNNNGLIVDSYSSQDYVFDTDRAGSYGGTRLLIKSPDVSNIYDYSAGNFIECDITLSAAPPKPPTKYYTISGKIVGQGTISGTGNYAERTTATLTATPASGWTFDYWADNDDYQGYYDNPWEFTVYRDWNITAVFFENTPPVVTYTVSVNVTGQGTTTGAGSYKEGDQVTLTATPSTGYEFNSWQINGTVVETNSTYQFIMGNQDVTITAVFVEEAEKHIYLCDNSGAHLAEMTNTGSTWNVTGSFTSGQYSIRATVEGEYNDAWFKFYQTQGDNRIFVGAGDDPSFEDIGTYIMIDDILVSFSLVEDQETGYYVVTYQNTAAMTVSTVETIVNSYIGDFVTGDEISAMGYMTQTDISAMGYMTQTDISAMGYMTATDISAMGYMTQTDISSMGYMTATDISAMSYVDSTSLSNMSYITMTDVQSLGYIDQTSLSNMSYVDSTSLSAMSYVDQTSLSSMAYVDNTYLSTYMNAVVGDINSILQTI